MECVKRDIFSEHLLWIRHQLPWKWVTAVLWLISQCRPGLTWTEGRHRVQCTKPLPRIVQNWPLMQGSTFHLGCSCFQQDLMPQSSITLKESAQRLQQFHSKKASLKVKLYHSHYPRGFLQSIFIFQRHLVCWRKLQADPTQIKRDPHAGSPGSGKEGVREGRSGLTS